MPFTNTSISKSSTFWLDKAASRAALANGNSLNIHARAARDSSEPILDIWGDMDCITIFANAFGILSDASLYPCTFEWILVPAITCVFDTDMPLASVTTTLTGRDDIRAGLLVRMSGFRMDRAVLYARIISGNLTFPQLSVQLYAVGDLRGTHRTNIEVGSAAG